MELSSRNVRWSAAHAARIACSPPPASSDNGMKLNEKWTYIYISVSYPLSILILADYTFIICTLASHTKYFLLSFLALSFFLIDKRGILKTNIKIAVQSWVDHLTFLVLSKHRSNNKQNQSK